MATLRRYHAPAPYDTHVETLVWKKSQSGTPRRRRSDRPPLTHDPGWDWDGTRILFTEKTAVPDREERDCDVCEFQRWEDEHSLALSERTNAPLSLFDVARYEMAKRRSRAKSGLEDFEVIRIPRVVHISDGIHDLEDSWELGEWEKLDASGFKRTYSEVARGFVDEKGPPNAPCFTVRTEDDPWECL